MSNRRIEDMLKWSDELLASLGYQRVAKGKYEKAVSAEFRYRVEILITGSVLLCADFIFGFVIPSINCALAGDQMSEHVGKRVKPNDITIFQKLYLIVERLKLPVTVPRITNETLQPADTAAIAMALKACEQALSSVDAVADYVMRDTSLPLGHHAFRVPILLHELGRHDDLLRYTARVEALNFLNNYDAFARVVSVSQTHAPH